MIEYSSFQGGYKFLVQTRDNKEFYVPNNYYIAYIKNDLVLI